MKEIKEENKKKKEYRVAGLWVKEKKKETYFTFLTYFYRLPKKEKISPFFSSFRFSKSSRTPRGGGREKSGRGREVGRRFPGFRGWFGGGQVNSRKHDAPRRAGLLWRRAASRRRRLCNQYVAAQRPASSDLQLSSLSSTPWLPPSLSYFRLVSHFHAVQFVRFHEFIATRPDTHQTPANTPSSFVQATFQRCRRRCGIFPDVIQLLSLLLSIRSFVIQFVIQFVSSKVILVEVHESWVWKSDDDVSWSLLLSQNLLLSFFLGSMNLSCSCQFLNWNWILNGGFVHFVKMDKWKKCDKGLIIWCLVSSSSLSRLKRLLTYVRGAIISWSSSQIQIWKSDDNIPRSLFISEFRNIPVSFSEMNKLRWKISKYRRSFVFVELNINGGFI